ncbi:MAG: signal recognition particle subunit SRP19/SEC65 family protein [Methanolinea sp.]|jgi:signal recognition particle subunit SRP19|nr:signal recognition particle subunit SRP19/SEC65 family protein [Methanolinea sp.]
MKGECILYPCYFNSALKRNEGRRIAISSAVRDPTLVDLERAVKRSGLQFRLEQKHYPSRWWQKEGRVHVQWNESKERLLKQVAAHLVAGK